MHGNPHGECCFLYVEMTFNGVDLCPDTALIFRLQVFHERGKPGGSFPTEETVLESSDDHSEQVFKERKVPLWEHLCKGIYVSFLSVLQLGYSQSVISLGAHLNLIGISFFILTFLAVCKLHCMV